ADELGGVAAGTETSMRDVFVQGHCVCGGRDELWRRAGGAGRGDNLRSRAKRDTPGWWHRFCSSAGGQLLFAGFPLLFEMPLDGFFSFFLSGLLFLTKAFLDGSIALFVIELAEVIRFSLHAFGGFAVLQQ